MSSSSYVGMPTPGLLARWAYQAPQVGRVSSRQDGWGEEAGWCPIASLEPWVPPRHLPSIDAWRVPGVNAVRDALRTVLSAVAAAWGRGWRNGEACLRSWYRQGWIDAERWYIPASRAADAMARAAGLGLVVYYGRDCFAWAAAAAELATSTPVAYLEGASRPIVAHDDVWGERGAIAGVAAFVQAAIPALTSVPALHVDTGYHGTCPAAVIESLGRGCGALLAAGQDAHFPKLGDRELLGDDLRERWRACAIIEGRPKPFIRASAVGPDGLPEIRVATDAPSAAFYALGAIARARTYRRREVRP
jgi:hypothetical protein